MPRILHYFPVVHTSADLGTLGESVRHAREAAIGRSGALREAARIERFWHEVETASGRIPIPSGRLLRVYQDGLPVCDNVEQIVNDLAGAGSANHRLLLKLAARGAVLMGTEDPDLLVEEYERAKAGLDRKHTPQADALLDRRDRFIASRINASLEPQETGILFIGALHSVAPHLDSGIQVTYPLGRSSATIPPGRRG